MFTAAAKKQKLRLKKSKGDAMDKIIELSFAQEGFRCWMCHEGLSTRARFCNHCGCIQPVRELDHFQRLGLARNIDLDLAVLERNYTAFQRSFAPDRFVIRSHAEKTYAQKHSVALTEAFDTLRDPVKRSRYWLELHAEENGTVRPDAGSPLLNELQSVLEASQEAIELDRLARRAGQEMEHGIMRLLGSLRHKNWKGANEVLTILDGLESLITQVREKRQAMTPQVAK
jgi:molecular chaperone HscB